jgi:hypothetical protein
MLAELKKNPRARARETDTRFRMFRHIDAGDVTLRFIGSGSPGFRGMRFRETV